MPQQQKAVLDFSEGLVRMYVTIAVSIDEMCTWTPERIGRFFDGLAQALSAVGKERTKDAGKRRRAAR